MSKRTKSQRIGSLGQSLIRVVVDRNPSWISRSQDQDFGIDLEIELAEPDVRGEILKVQIKSTEKPDITPKGVKAVLEKKYVRLAESFRVPLIFVVADTTSNQAWYVWLQGWLLAQRRLGKAMDSIPDAAVIYIPESDTLCAGLDGPLKEIARWANADQLLISLSDAMRTAAATCNEKILLSLAELCGAADAALTDFPFELLIDLLVELSNRRCLPWEFAMLGRFLAILARIHGGKISKNSVMRMVVPGAVVSRAGLLGLGSLYDSHEQHVHLLQLPNAFEAAGFPDAAFYCRLREKYPGVKSIQLALGEFDYTVDGLTVNVQDKRRFRDKWINRGESVYLDFLTPTGLRRHAVTSNSTDP